MIKKIFIICLLILLQTFNAFAGSDGETALNENKTELMVKLMIMAAIYEFMFMHKTPIKVVISEYLKVADFFVQDSQKGFLNAILEKVSKVSRNENE